MALKQRDYTNMRETERIQEAIKLTCTQVKDYTFKHIISVSWKINPTYISNHLVKIKFGGERFIGIGVDISRAVHKIVEGQDENDWLPRMSARVDSFDSSTKPITFDTLVVNDECLRDHVARVTIGECSSLIDLEELLKATRYA